MRGTCEREDRETKRGRQEAEPIVLLNRKITSERETDTTRKQRSGQRAHCIALVKGLCLDKRDRHAGRQQTSDGLIRQLLRMKLRVERKAEARRIRRKRGTTH